jgi:capsular polysaccharide biosynthesis protein
MKSNVQVSDDTEFSEYVVFSRQGQQRWSIINFEDVMDALRPFGFWAYQPEDYSLRKQIRLFDQAWIIVGSLGSGLANMIFANDRTLVEIFPKNEIKAVFYVVANECGHRYD